MTTLLVTHQACLGHDPGRMHPESPARLKAVLAALEAPGVRDPERRAAPLAEARADRACACPALCRYACCMRFRRLAMSVSTPIPSLRRVPASRAAGRRRRDRGRRRGRWPAESATPSAPCGRRAITPEPTRAMGFCLFNNVAVGGGAGARGARSRARRRGRLRRPSRQRHPAHVRARCRPVLRLDAPVAVLLRAPARPTRRGVGNIVNVPLAPMPGSREFRAAMTEIVLPALRAFPAGPAADFRRLRRPCR